ncbi:MAG: hypothetical protein KBT46_02575, partial [Ruminococcus sp.]|nr:hypothetical protein [Candidatus Copronaster equi]
ISMLFKRKPKQPEIVKIDDLKFLTDEAKEAFRVLEIPDTSYLQGKEGDTFYYDYCVESGGVVDKSILYEMRAVAYFANTVKPDEKKLRWWYWKDTNTDNQEMYSDD